MKLYAIRDWNTLYENNRSRTVESLSWVKIPNRHDGENFTSIMAHPEGSKIFSAFILMVEIASRCVPRGTLIRTNGTPHDGTSMAVKCRAPVSWFDIGLPYLENHTDWLEVSDIIVSCKTDSQVTPRLAPDCQAGAQEGKGMEGKEWKEGKVAERASGVTLLSEIFDEWNRTATLPKCLLVSDKRKRALVVRCHESFFLANWKAAIAKVAASRFCLGENDRGWRASFDWFITPDVVAKIMEGKYDGNTNNKTGGPAGAKSFDRNKGTLNAGHAERYDLKKIQADRAVRDAKQSTPGTNA